MRRRFAIAPAGLAMAALLSGIVPTIVLAMATMVAGTEPVAQPVRVLEPGFAVVRPGYPIRFPRDHGAHRDFRTEWWYVTGWIEAPGEPPKGFQITFFRSATGKGGRVAASHFAPHQIVLAHAALSDPVIGHILHESRIARESPGLAGAATGDAALRLDGWTLMRRADGVWRARLAGRAFALDLAMAPTQSPLLQGQAGYSRKGPDPAQASYYYSLPQMVVRGTLTRQDPLTRKVRAMTVKGRAWLDREWSSTLLDPRATGWDWVGLNFAHGGALTAFRMRDQAGRTLWAGGSYRSARGAHINFGPDDVRFINRRLWTSPRSGGRYPVDPVVTVQVKGRRFAFALRPLFDDQELSGGGMHWGPTYWEGAVTTPGARGYLEMTGYAQSLRAQGFAG